MFNPAKSSKKIKEEYIDYIATTLYMSKKGNGSSSLNDQFREILKEKVTKGPFVEMSYAFKKGHSINELIDSNDLSCLFKDLEKDKPEDYKINVPLNRQLYLHQEEAIKLINKGDNTVITTGTGSGKTECFLYPLINSLLREKENGTLNDPGVRAILIYPMNALANDQMKRLRNILMYYPDITFGVYTGDTPTKKGDIENYRRLHETEKYKELREPLPNEYVTREEMNENPPHILCTNYSMLEYMLLTPNRGAVLRNAKIKFVILDEAHVYTGATGMETAILIRRLMAKLLNDQENPQFILTSATLGEKNHSEADIVKFAKNLTGGDFKESDIVFSERIIESQPETENIPIELFNELANAEENFDFENIFSKYGYFYDSNLSIEENLFDLCIRSNFYWIIRENYSVPVEIKNLSNWLDLSIDETIAFLYVCAKANKNNVSLFEIRYHFFLRAIEGLYYAPAIGKLFLERLEECNDNGNIVKVFEISVCKNCGDIAIIGQIRHLEDGYEYLISREKSIYESVSKQEESRFFHIIDDTDDENKEDVDYEDVDENEEDLDEDDLSLRNSDKRKENKKYEDYYLCPICGQISKINEGEPNCGHKTFIKVRAYDKSVKLNKSKCLNCNRGNYNRFYLGTEASTSIIAEALFEQLPEKEVDVKASYSDAFYKKLAGKQFLAFSDSRSEAAYFSSYADQRYENMVTRRVLVKLLYDLKTGETYGAKNGCIPLKKLASLLAEYFLEFHTLEEDLLNNINDEDKALKMAWTVLLEELISCRRTNSLQSLGYLKFKYLGNEQAVVDYFKNKYFKNLSIKDVKKLLDELVFTFAYFGAVQPPRDAHFNSEDKKTIFFTDKPLGITISKDNDTAPYVASWLPMARKNSPNSYYKNYRLELVLRALGNNKDNETAIKFLKEFFEMLTNHNNQFKVESISSAAEYALSVKTISVCLDDSPEAKWYRCNKCGKITTFNFLNQCPVLKCNGTLEEIEDIDVLMKDNYYHKIYEIKPNNYYRKMIIREHTAQLSKQDASDFQIKFEKNNINALSCSTTFEMGVDVGDLETVFLRDMPPSSSNYAQRAGRAGRSKDSSAFVLTYCKLSSHDFNYFQDPISMINGKIIPPKFKLDNEKIVLRQVYSLLMGYLFNKEPYYFEDENGYQRTCDYFVNNTYPRVVDLVNHTDDELNNLIYNSFRNIISDSKFDEFNKKWRRELIGDEGRLTNAVKNYTETIDEFDNQIAIFDQQGTDESRKKASKLTTKKNWFKNNKTLQFLVTANILPKYGFPVDTVELRINFDDANLYRKDLDGLRLSRDMSQAINDYAPGAKVIANNRMYTSRYISKYWKNGQKDFDKIYICECPECRTLNISYVKDPSSFICVGCGKNMSAKSLWEEAISPVAGMISENSKGEKVPLNKPKKAFKTDYYYVEEDKNSHTVKLDIGDKLLTIVSSKTDTIGVTSSLKEPFYVCQHCGKAYSIHEKIITARDSDDTPITESNCMKFMLANRKAFCTEGYHLTPSGAKCPSHWFNKQLLFHSFKTDIVQLIFNDTVFSDYYQALSLLYALLDAISKVLDIERNEISGVVNKEFSYRHSQYKFILFDNVPGGAGYVKRILDDDYTNLYKIIKYAYEKTKNCTCDENSSCYNCLRTYENQRFHTDLNRSSVYKFLQPYYLKRIKKHYMNNLKITKSLNFMYDSWDEYISILDDTKMSDSVKEIIKLLPLPNKINIEFSINDVVQPVKAMLYWEKYKIFLFDHSESKYVLNNTNSDDLNFYVADETLNIAKFLELFEEGK